MLSRRIIGSASGSSNRDKSVTGPTSPPPLLQDYYFISLSGDASLRPVINQSVSCRIEHHRISMPPINYLLLPILLDASD